MLIHVSSWCAARLAVLGRPALNGVVFAGVGAGIVFAGALCIALMTLGAGSRMAWLLLGVAGFLVTATGMASGQGSGQRDQGSFHPLSLDARRTSPRRVLRRFRHRLHHSGDVRAGHGEGGDPEPGNLRMGMAGVRRGRDRIHAYGRRLYAA